MLPALATTDQLNARLPEPLEEAEDLARAQAALDDASTLVRDETGRDWVDESNVPAPAALVQQIVLAAALRAVVNPEGTISETLGRWSETRSRETAGLTVELTENEIRALRRLVAKPGLVSVPVVRPEMLGGTAPPFTVDDGFGGDPLPWPLPPGIV